MPKNVHKDYEAARQYLAALPNGGSFRVYRVLNGERERYVVSRSPTAAAGEAAEELGLRVELVERKERGHSPEYVAAVVASMTAEDRRRAIAILKGG